MRAFRKLACLVVLAMSAAGCAYTVEITQPAANATVPPGAPVMFGVTIHNADGRSFAAEIDGTAVPAMDITFNTPPPDAARPLLSKPGDDQSLVGAGEPHLPGERERSAANALVGDGQ